MEPDARPARPLRPARPRRWDLWGLAAGLALGGGDVFFFFFFDADMRIGSVDVSLPLSAMVIVTYGAIGWLAGRVALDRARIRSASEIIEMQLRELEASQQQLLQSEKLAAIGRLAAGVAHEVRNPLGVIRASASMVQETQEPESESWRALGFIREEIDRLNGLISSLLDYARPQDLHMQRVALEKVVDRALDLAHEDLRARSIRVEREALGGDAPAHADPDLLPQVVYGLVTNAAEALGEGGRIVVRAGSDGETAVLEVADSGPGVADEDRARIFEPFFTTKDAGTGLGLAMAARIVESHHGRLQALPGRGAGAGGAGACFEIRVPVHAAESA